MGSLFAARGLVSFSMACGIFLDQGLKPCPLRWQWIFFWLCGSLLLCMDFSLVALRRLLIAVASLVVENGLQDMWAPVVAVRGLSSCGSWTREHRLNSCGLWAWLLCGMWNLPRPRIESASPALAGRFFTTESPGKPGRWIFIHCTTREVPSVLNNLVALFKEEKGIGDINHGLP